MSFHQYSWNSEVKTMWIILIGWHHKTSNNYLLKCTVSTYNRKGRVGNENIVLYWHYILVLSGQYRMWFHHYTAYVSSSWSFIPLQTPLEPGLLMKKKRYQNHFDCFVKSAMWIWQLQDFCFHSVLQFSRTIMNLWLFIPDLSPTSPLLWWWTK